MLHLYTAKYLNWKLDFKFPLRGPRNCRQTETAQLWLSTQKKIGATSLSLSLPSSQSLPSKVRWFECNPMVFSPLSKTLQVLDDLCPLHPELVLGHALLHIGDQLFDNGVVLGMFWTNDKFELLVRALPPQVRFERVKLCLALSPRLCIEEDVCLFVIKWSNQ